MTVATNITSRVITPVEAAEQGLVNISDRALRLRCENGFYKDCRKVGKTWIINKQELIQKEDK